jgi:hypothetical protein
VIEKVIPEHLQSTYQMICRAYPDGIPRNEYFPLLAVLAEHMSEECLSDVIGFLPGFDPIVVTNDVAKVLSTDRPAFGDMERIKERLKGASYGDWLLEE